MRFVFLHGGPGFNSFAEQAILGPVWRDTGHEIVFWNEPSRLRPEGDPFEEATAFPGWLASAERCVLEAATTDRVHVIAHSVAIAGLDIARRHPERLAGLTLVAPAVDTFACFRNVLRLAQRDLAHVKRDVSAAIAGCLSRTRATLDDAMREGLLNALHDDRLFTHYFAGDEPLRKTMEARARPGGQFDAESFFAVMNGLHDGGGALLSTAPISVPALALFGALDPVTPLADQRDPLRASIPDCRIEALDDCNHYLHLEQPYRFAEIVIRWATSLATT